MSYDDQINLLLSYCTMCLIVNFSFFIPQVPKSLYPEETPRAKSIFMSTLLADGEEGRLDEGRIERGDNGRNMPGNKKFKTRDHFQGVCGKVTPGYSISH